METAKEFIYDRVQSLVEKFKNIKASIHFEPMSQAYFVQLQPTDFYKDSKDLKSNRLNILDEFYENNFDSSLVFVNDESLLELKSFECVFTGEDFIDLKYLLCFSDFNLRDLNDEVFITLSESMIEQPFDYSIAA